MDADAGLRARIEQLESELEALRTFADAPYRTVVEDMSELIVRWLPDGTRLFVNDSYCRLFGVSRAEVIGTSFWPLVSEEDQARVRARIAALSPEAPVSRGRHRAVGPDGSVIWMEWVDRALFGGEGEIVELQSVGRDITEQVQLEQQARKVGQADAVARTSTAVSHDLNNVLTVVMGQVGLLRLGQAEAHDLDLLEQAVQKASQIVDQLGRVQVGVALELTSIELNECVRQMQPLLEEVIPTHAHLSVTLTAEPAVIRGDAIQIDQVLLNLVKNAADALVSEGRVEIVVEIVEGAGLGSPSVGEIEPDTTYVSLGVRDTGGGIPPDILPSIFEPRVTTKRTGQGVGLSTVKAIVEGHSGAILVASSPQGAEFRVVFPPLAAGGA